MKKITAILLCMLIFLSTINVVADESIKMYSPDGGECIINRSELDAWEAAGWYSYPVVRVYLEDGTEAVIYEGALNDWINVGWLYEPPTVRLYSNKLGTATVHKSMVDTYLALGWSRLSQVVNFQVTEDTNPEIKVLKDFAFNELDKRTVVCDINGLEYKYDFDDLVNAKLFDCDNDGELEFVALYKNDYITGQMLIYAIFDVNNNRVYNSLVCEFGRYGGASGQGIRYYDGKYYFYEDSDMQGGRYRGIYLLQNNKIIDYNGTSCDCMYVENRQAADNMHNQKYVTVWNFEYDEAMSESQRKELVKNCFDLNPLTMYCRHDYSTIKAFPHEIAKYSRYYYTIDEHMWIYSYKDIKKISRVGWPQYAAEGGWYPYPVVDMYAPNGTMAIVPQSEMENWKNQGWYDEKYWELGMSFDKLKSIYPNMRYVYYFIGGEWFDALNGRTYAFPLYPTYDMQGCTGVIESVSTIFPNIAQHANGGYINKTNLEALLGVEIEVKEDIAGYFGDECRIDFSYDGYDYTIPCDMYGNIYLYYYAFIQ